MDEVVSESLNVDEPSAITQSRVQTDTETLTSLLLSRLLLFLLFNLLCFITISLAFLLGIICSRCHGVHYTDAAKLLLESDALCGGQALERGRQRHQLELRAQHLNEGRGGR